MTAEQWLSVAPQFKKHEFVCPHCGIEDMDYKFMVKLYQARVISNFPFLITSGYRCEEHNTKIGGAKNSAHLSGKAADINDNRDPVKRARIMNCCKAAGIKQFEVSRDGHIHVMDDDTKPTPFLGVEP